MNAMNSQAQLFRIGAPVDKQRCYSRFKTAPNAYQRYIRHVSFALLFRPSKKAHCCSKILRNIISFTLQASDVNSSKSKLTMSTLESIRMENLADHKKNFERAAEAVWEQLMANPDCRQIGEFMLNEMTTRPVQVSNE